MLRMSPRNPCRNESRPAVTPDIAKGQSNDETEDDTQVLVRKVHYRCFAHLPFFGLAARSLRSVGKRLVCAVGVQAFRVAGSFRPGCPSGWFRTRLFSPIRHHRMNGCQSDHHLRFRRGSTLSAGRRDAGTALRQNGVWISILPRFAGAGCIGSKASDPTKHGSFNGHQIPC